MIMLELSKYKDGLMFLSTQFKSRLLCQETDCSETNFAQDVKYTIIVGYTYNLK
jgi:hypothetical protein